MSESEMLLNPDVAVRELYVEVINQLIMDNMTMHAADKILDILRDHANDRTREEMDIVYRWMVQ